MFQIKTDIRQYNCETREKVEKLIRNWVIRPSDLIYNEDAGEWNPIGQHPSFDELFRELEDEESRVPDTVVTSDRPSGDDEEGGEVTQITESPLEDEEEPESEEAPEDEEAPEPPEPSEGVEGHHRDSDEITMMTDKTLDMMRMDGDEEGGEKDEDTDVVERDEVTEEEDTDVVGRDDVDGSPEEPTHIIDQKDVDGAPSDDESTNVVDRDEIDEEDDDEDEDEADEETIVVDREATGEEDPEEGESNGGGRHGLPEDVFVTNEIPKQSAEDSVLDELGELDADDEDFDLDEGLSEGSEEVTDEREAPESGERRAKWRIVMSEDEDDVDAEWENVAEEMRDTDELSQEELETSVAEDRGAPQEDLDFEDDEAPEDEPEESDVDADEVDESDEVDEVDESDEVEEVEESDDADKSTDQDEQDLEEVEVEAVEEDEDDDDLDGLLNDAAELVGVNVRDSESGGEGREPVKTPVEQTATDPAFVSEGYKMDLPIDVGPSDEDLAFGVSEANVSEDVKAATFPYPKPKHPGRAIIRTFGLGEELADDDDFADDLPDAGDPDVDPHAETKPFDGGKKKKTSNPSAKPVPNPSASTGRASSANSGQPKDQSALIVLVLLGTFIIALILAVYFLG